MRHAFWLGEGCDSDRVDDSRRLLAAGFLKRYPGKVVAAELHGVYTARFLEAVKHCGYFQRADSGEATGMDFFVQLASDLFCDPLSTAARERLALGAARAKLVDAAKGALELVAAVQQRSAGVPNDVHESTRATIAALSSILALPEVDAEDLVDKYVFVMRLDGFPPKLISALLRELGYPSATANLKSVNTRASRLKKKHGLIFPTTASEKTKQGRKLRTELARTVTASR